MDSDTIILVFNPIKVNLFRIDLFNVQMNCNTFSVNVNYCYFFQLSLSISNV